MERRKLLDALAKVEAAHFRSIHDSGANPTAQLIWTALRRELGLPPLWKEDLAAWDGKAYVEPIGSRSIANLRRHQLV